MGDKRYYEVLCIADFSTSEEVRVAYKSLALKYHPDKNLDDPTAVECFRAVSRAYEVLSNEETKRKYDSALRATLSNDGRSAVGAVGGQGSVNPYTVETPSVSDIYRELYQRQAARASARNRTSSAPPNSRKEFGSQYTKEQQERFRKQEKARQQELRRQREKERKEQRERERRALREEQERQEELHQRRCSQRRQQPVSPLSYHSTRTATAATATTASDSAAHTGGSSGASPRMRRGASHTLRTEESRSPREVHTPKAVFSGAPVRLTAVRNSFNSTPRAFPVTHSFSPSRKTAANPVGAETSASAVPSPASASREEESTDVEAAECQSSGRWYTPFAASVNENSLDEGQGATGSHSSHGGSAVRAERQVGVTPSTRQTHAVHTASVPLSRSAPVLSGAIGTSAQQSKPTRPSTGATNTTSGWHGDEETSASRGGDRQRPSFSHPPAAHIRSANGGTAPPSSTSSTTPRRLFTPRCFVGTHPTLTRTSLSSSRVSSRNGTIRVEGSTRAHSFSAGAATTRARVNTSSSSNNSVTSRRASGSFSVIRKARSTTSLTDAEVMAKKRREALEREKERQRVARLAEEERQFRRVARAAAQRRKDAAAVSTATVSATKRTQQPISFEEQLMYLIQDEASERDQLIEREEELAWRRLHRHHTIVAPPGVAQYNVSSLVAEEEARRNDLLNAYRLERRRLQCLLDERVDRLYVEGREVRDRRQLMEREAAGIYQVQRASQRRASVMREEALRLRRQSTSSKQTHVDEGMVAADAGHPTLASAAGATALHQTSCFVDVYAPESEGSCDPGMMCSRRYSQFHGQSQQHHRQADELWLPLSDPQTSVTAGATSTGTLDSKRDGTRGAVSCSSTMGVSASAQLASFLSATSIEKISAVVARHLPDGGAPPTPAHEASRHALPHRHESDVSSVNTDAFFLSSTTTTTTAANRDAKLSLTPAQRRALALFKEETYLRDLLVSQQHREEVTLRRRRATVLHSLFAKDKVKAVRQAQRSALMDVAALKAQLRLLERKAGLLASPHQPGGGSHAVPRLARLPQPPEIVVAGTSVVAASPDSSTSLSVDAVTPSYPHLPLRGDPGRTTEGAGKISDKESASVGSFRLETITTDPAVRSGWTELPDSDIER